MGLTGSEAKRPQADEAAPRCSRPPSAMMEIQIRRKNPISRKAGWNAVQLGGTKSSQAGTESSKIRPNKAKENPLIFLDSLRRIEPFQ
jgi:hypothetical protein